MTAPDQRMVFTPIPKGISGGNVIVSVYIAPRLTPSASPGTLGAFPDWLPWPSTAITWGSVKVNGIAHAATVVSAAPIASLWSALFNSTTPVNGFNYQSLASQRIFSYPAGNVRSYFVDAYTQLASTTPSEWPDGETQLLQGILSNLPTTDDARQALVSQLLGSFRGGTGNTVPGEGTIPQRAPSPGLDLTQAKLFLDTMTATLPVGATNSSTPSPTPPTFDFHEALSLIVRHPPLLRMLGLVVDLSIPVPTGSLPNPVSVQVIPKWTPKIIAAGGTNTNVSPIVKTDPTTWLPAPRPTAPELAAGQLRLSDAGAYELLEVDLDGASTKMLAFAATVERALGPYRTFDTPTSYAVPSLRSAGLSLAWTANAAALYGTLQSSDTLNTNLTASPPPKITLYAEDVTQGYRIDAYDQTTGAWGQLCARSAAPSPGPGGYVVGASPSTVVPVPSGDEGWVELGLTSPGTGTSGDLCLPETLIGWRGWSLVAPRPGQHLSDSPTDGLTPETYNPATGSIPLQIAYAATPGTLPPLRFGHTYQLRARAVDLAGNSIPFSTDTSAAAFTWASPAALYGRAEPVASPVLVPTAPRTPGDSLETLVIRSNYDIPDTSPSILPTSRWVAPPTASVQLAEQHGALDGATGKPQASLYATLAALDGQTFATPTVMTAQGGLDDTQPLNAGQQWIYYGGSTLTLPYLPDPIARGAAFQFLPGTTAVSPTTLVSFSPSWPSAQLFSLEVKPGSGAPSQTGGVLTVLAPKASVSTVRMSSVFDSADLGLMNLWNWLSDAGLATTSLQSLILSGQHWMFTPYRELTIVHAVQQPLLAPDLPAVTPSRSAGDTFALVDGDITFDPPSTQRLDVLAQWTEPFDDGKNPKGSIELSGNGRVGELDIDSGSPSTVPLNAMRHDFGDTKHRNVYYQTLATTRFLEYFAKYTTITLSDTTPVTVDAAGLAQGSVVVTDATTAVSYQSGVDYAEDDTAGTIARITAGAIPTGASVNVQYVEPPVTRSSLEASASPPTPQGALANIPSSARPLPPDVRYILPAFQWQEKSTASKITSVRAGNVLRVYLGRPWWSSGDGELLGAIVADGPPGVPFPPELLPFVTRYGRDPLVIAGPVSPTPGVADFLTATATQNGVLLAEQTDTNPWVDVAGHPVGWDSTHQLWYADVAINVGASSWPFVRLGFVRYQPSTVPGTEVSRVAQADFAQLAPDRSATLTFPTTTTVKIVVTGPDYLFNAYEYGPTMTATVETLQPGVADPELQWVPTPSTVSLTPTAVGPLLNWNGTLTLPVARGSQSMRILISEAENYPPSDLGDAQQRVTYFDAITI